MALVIGETRGHMGQSALLAEAFGIEAGDAPPVDLKTERKHGEFLRKHRKLVHAATDLGDGGLALAAFEMAEAAGFGLWLESGAIPTLFAEDQARYLVACDVADAAALIAAGEKAGVPVKQVGQFGGQSVCFGTDSAALVDLSNLYRTAFEKAVG
jgi:phosphoribosylformylglycinamidine synthase